MHVSHKWSEAVILIRSLLHLQIPEHFLGSGIVFTHFILREETRRKSCIYDLTHKNLEEKVDVFKVPCWAQ